MLWGVESRRVTLVRNKFVSEHREEGIAKESRNVFVLCHTARKELWKVETR